MQRPCNCNISPAMSNTQKDFLKHCADTPDEAIKVVRWGWGGRKQNYISFLSSSLCNFDKTPTWQQLIRLSVNQNGETSKHWPENILGTACGKCSVQILHLQYFSVWCFTSLSWLKQKAAMTSLHLIRKIISIGWLELCIHIPVIDIQGRLKDNCFTW